MNMQQLNNMENHNTDELKLEVKQALEMAAAKQEPSRVLNMDDSDKMLNETINILKKHSNTFMLLDQVNFTVPKFSFHQVVELANSNEIIKNVILQEFANNNVKIEEGKLSSIANEYKSDVADKLNILFNIPKDISEIIVNRTIENPDDYLVQYRELYSMFNLHKTLEIINVKLKEDIRSVLGEDFEAEIFLDNVDENDMLIHIHLNVNNSDFIDFKLVHDYTTEKSIVPLIQEINNEIVNAIFKKSHDVYYTQYMDFTDVEYNPYKNGISETLIDVGFNLGIDNNNQNLSNSHVCGTNFINENIMSKIMYFILNHPNIKPANDTQEELDKFNERKQYIIETLEIHSNIYYDDKYLKSFDIQFQYGKDDENEYFDLEDCHRLKDLDNELSELKIHLDNKKNNEE